MPGLAWAKGLTVLRVKFQPLSDDALAAIAKLPKLEAVEYANTAVTNAGVAKLRQMKPDLDVQFPVNE